MSEEQRQRVEEFLKKLTELSDEYGLEITAEGTSPLLYDFFEGGYVAEFFNGIGEYVYYE